MPRQLNKIQKRLLAIALLAVALILLSVFENHPAAVERYYSQGLYVFICRALHPVFNLFPFSLGDVLYIAVVAYLIYFFVKLIVLVFKRQFKRIGTSILGLIIGIQAGMLVFYLFWGLNYYRPPAAQRLGLRDATFTPADLQAVTCTIIDSANACRARIKQEDTLQSNEAIFKNAVAAVTKLSADSANFRTYHPHIKPALLTWFMNYVGTAGYYNPFTSEAQLNYQMPVFTRPFVACHEMAHQTGYGMEDEASFAGFLAAIGSHDRLLRYSAYQAALDECMRALMRSDRLANGDFSANRELRTHLSPAVRNDFIAEGRYWRSFYGKTVILSSVFYDDYLKANNQPYGLNTYNQMVLLLMAWYHH